MANKIVNPNAREALNKMKMEIANELGMESHVSEGNKTSYDCDKKGGDLGGLMSKTLVEMGKEELIRQYYSK